MLGYLVTAGDGVRAAGGGAPVNTDDNSRIEFDTPKDIAREHADEIAALLGAQRVDPWSFVRGDSPAYEDHRKLGAQILHDQRRMQEASGKPAVEALPTFEEINARNPHDPIAAREVARLRKVLGR